MNDLPLISVVMTTRNRAEYVKKAAASVFNQTYKNIELVIINNGSTDNTPLVLLELSKKDARVMVLTNEVDLGHQESLNRAIGAAHGTYIARLDDDDLWPDPEKLEKQVAFLQSHTDYVLTGGGAIWVDKNKKELFRFLLPKEDQAIRAQMLFKNRFVHSSVVFRKKSWEQAGKYNKAWINSDWVLWLQMGKFGKFYNFPQYFVHYLKWEHNMTNFNLLQNLKEQMIIRQTYRQDYPNYGKARFLGYINYLVSFLPFRNKLQAMHHKIKTK